MKALLAGLALLLSGCATIPTFAPRWEVDVSVVVSAIGGRATAFVTAYVDVPASARPVTLTMRHDEVLVDVWTCAEMVCQGSVSWLRASTPPVLVVGVEDRLGKTAFTTVELHQPVSRPVPPRLLRR